MFIVFALDQEECWAQRMGVVFMARVHPGETNSSWMMHGILKYLTSDNKHAKVNVYILLSFKTTANTLIAIGNCTLICNNDYSILICNNIIISQLTFVLLVFADSFCFQDHSNAES